MKLRYVYEQHEIVARFVAAMIPTVGYRGFGNCRTIGIVDEGGQLIAGIVYNNWNPMSGVIEINGAALPGKNWLTRETIRRMYGFAFEQCACQLVIQRTPVEDERLLRQLAIGGFTFVKVARLFGRDHDGVICSLTVEDWANSKFIKRRVIEPRVVEPRVVEPHPLDIPEWLRRDNKEAA